MKKDSSRIFGHYIPVATVVVIITSVAAFSFIREYSLSIFPPAKPVLSRNDGLQWLKAVRSGNEKQAILFAEKLVDDGNLPLPDQDYIQVLLEMKLSTLLITEKFNRYDFVLWQDAVFLKKIADEKIHGKENIFQQIFSVVMKEIECRPGGSENYVPALSAVETWSRKYGSSHEICRFICALAFQAGCEPQIVSLFDEKRNIVHLFCEIRRGDKTAVIDPRFKKIWTDATFADIAEGKRDISTIWPENIVMALKNYLYLLPAEFQDYKIFNQRLVKILSDFHIPDTPRFAENPRTRIENCLRFSPEQGVQGIFTYWRYPFFAAGRQPDFPVNWKIE